jgi:predicted lactoylglutathione lyase
MQTFIPSGATIFPVQEFGRQGEGIGMFDHVQIKVSDLASSRSFYEAVFKAIGIGVVFEIKGVVVGFGHSPHEMLEIRQAGESAPVSKSVHVALAVNSKVAVSRFHAAAIAHGGTDTGHPGYRPEYEAGYFAAFVLDRDGHNLEAVFVDKATQGLPQS